MRALLVALLVAPWAVACNDEPDRVPPATAAAEAPLGLPLELAGKAEIVPPGDPDEPRADLASAVRGTGKGGLARGIVVRLTADIPIWRMWSGPTKKGKSGRADRMGQWWSYDAPHGTQAGYRAEYAICHAWNDLTWMTRCTLKKGAVVAVGPGQSVGPKACGDATGEESYPENRRAFQVWISRVWERSREVDCPDAADYEIDARDISQPKK